GIGPARRKALMRKYESAEDMKNASIEELADIPEMNREAAENVYNYFKRG
nr:excinuclease ABC subunit UvrC [Lachnospiraceae bacterium]